MRMASREQVNHMTAATYFKLFTMLMKKNPLAAADAPIIAKDGQGRDSPRQRV